MAATDKGLEEIPEGMSIAFFRPGALYPGSRSLTGCKLGLMILFSPN